MEREAVSACPHCGEEFNGAVCFNCGYKKPRENGCVKVVGLLLMTAGALFVGMMGLCCLAIITAGPPSPHDDIDIRGLRAFAWILLPIWIGLLYVVLRQIASFLGLRD